MIYAGSNCACVCNQSKVNQSNCKTKKNQTYNRKLYFVSIFNSAAWQFRLTFLGWLVGCFWLFSANFVWFEVRVTITSNGLRYFKLQTIWFISSIDIYTHTVTYIFLLELSVFSLETNIIPGWQRTIDIILLHWLDTEALHLYSKISSCGFGFIFFFFKVHMTWKIFAAYLKGLSKCRRMAFFFLKYLFSF